MNINHLPKLRIAYITVEFNDEQVLNGHPPTCFELSRILHEYADMIRDGRGGQRAVEIYIDTKGNKLTSSVVNWLGHRIPHEPMSFDR